MCQRTQILAVSDIITKIPDELPVSPQEADAILTVLRLLTRLLDSPTAH